MLVENLACFFIYYLVFEFIVKSGMWGLLVFPYMEQGNLYSFIGNQIQCSVLFNLSGTKLIFFQKLFVLKDSL